MSEDFPRTCLVQTLRPLEPSPPLAYGSSPLDLPFSTLHGSGGTNSVAHGHQLFYLVYSDALLFSTLTLSAACPPCQRSAQHN